MLLQLPGTGCAPNTLSAEVFVSEYPVLLHTAIDARDCRRLAEFYRELLGLHYREGEEPPTDGSPDDAD